jgi:hypothetical protein
MEADQVSPAGDGSAQWWMTEGNGARRRDGGTVEGNAVVHSNNRIHDHFLLNARINRWCNSK